MPVQSKRRFRFLRFTASVELAHNVIDGPQEMRVLSEIDAEDGWLITLNSGWFEIRMWRDGHWLDEGGGLVERARIAAAIPYEYPDGTEISEEFPDDLYPERYG